VIRRTGFGRCRLLEPLGPVLQRLVERIVALLDRAAHDRPEQREECAANVLDVGESHLSVAERLDCERAVAGEDPVSSRVAVPGQASIGLDVDELGLDLG
jgi:hypothetical protein